MSRRYSALGLVALAFSLFGVGAVRAAPQETKPETPPAESDKQQASGGLLSFLFESKLQRALKRGLRPGGSIAKELEKIDGLEVVSASDGKAVCEALATLLQREVENVPTSPEDFLQLALLFQYLPEDETPAFDELDRRGLGLLVKLYDRQLQRIEPGKVEHLLQALNTLASYGSEAGEERILAAIQRQLGTEADEWEEIFENLFAPPTASEDFLKQLAQNPPAGKAGLAMLDAANAASVDGDLPTHPFDSPAGRDRLRVWLSNQNEKYPAYLAAVALAFVSEEIRKQLLPLAAIYPDKKVQIEAAWAAGLNGDENGLRTLVRYCRELEHSAMAQRYLEEIDRGDLIPPEAKDPDFNARAKFSDWLQHPNELGQAPDEVEIIDRRELKWPLREQPSPFWLLRYRLTDSLGLDPDDVGCGLVGSETWCFFDPEMLRRPPEDNYAIHCCWEMEQEELIELQEADSPELSAERLKLLQSPLENPKLLASARVGLKLKLPARNYYLAAGKLDGAEGWMLFGDSEAVWYPKSEQPESTSPTTLLRIHLGGKLLGFKTPPNRKEYLSRELPKQSPEKFLNAYEHLMEEFWEAAPADQAMLLAELPLTERFGDYLESLVATKGGSKEQYLLEKYSEILDWAESVDEPARAIAFSGNGFLAEYLESYIAALVSAGDAESVPALLERLSPNWDDVSGYSRLGNAAYRAGRLELAEKWLAKIAAEFEDRHLKLEMCLLAEVFHRRGEVEKAKALLLDCLGKLALEVRQSEYEAQHARNRQLYSIFRETFLRLFPDGAAELLEKKLPESIPLKEIDQPAG